MSTFKAKDGTVYDLAMSLRVARALVSEFNLDVLTITREPGLAYAADVALKIHLLSIPRNLRAAESMKFDKNFTAPGELMQLGTAMLEELANFFQKLGLIPERAEKAGAGSGGTSTNTPPSPESKTSARSRSAN